MSTHEEISPNEKAFILLSRAASLGDKVVLDAVAPIGITVAEFNFLRIVESNPKVTARDIQAFLGLAAPSIAQMVAKLEKKGFIKRDRSSDDGRVLHLRSTFWGRRALNKASVAVDQNFHRLKLNPKLMASLVPLLSSFADSVTDRLSKEKADK